MRRLLRAANNRVAGALMRHLLHVVNNRAASALMRHLLHVASNRAASALTHHLLRVVNNRAANVPLKAAARRAAMPRPAAFQKPAAHRAVKKAALLRRRAAQHLLPRHATARPKDGAMTMRTMKASMAKNTQANAGTGSAATAAASRWRSSTACWTFWRKSVAPAACSTRSRPSLRSACTPSALNAAWVRPQVSSRAKARMALAATNARKAPARATRTKAPKA